MLAAQPKPRVLFMVESVILPASIGMATLAL